MAFSIQVSSLFLCFDLSVLKEKKILVSPAIIQLMLTVCLREWKAVDEGEGY